jgi:hypothetical protein
MMVGYARFFAIQILAVLVFVDATSSSARADQVALTMHPELGAEYEFAAAVDNQAASGMALVTANDQFYDLFRRGTDGFLATGFGLQVDGVLGAVLVPYPRRTYPGLGLVIYKIDGGSLKGFRLPEVVLKQERRVGREELEGPPTLNGRYRITLSENPFGQPYYDGTVEIAPHGEIYQVRWFTPDLAYFGTGVKLGDVFVAAYSQRGAPSVVAYCIGPDWLIGIGGLSDRKTLSDQTLHRVGSPLPPWSGVRPSHCPQ